MNRELVELGKAVVTNKPAGNYSLTDMHEAFRSKIAELVTVNGQMDFYQWQKNKIEVFEILSEVLSEIEPKKIKPLQQFMEIKRVPENVKAKFTLRKGLKGVRRFVTKVALAGVYERVRLDRDSLELDTYAHGGAIYQTMESFLNGTESLSELLTIFLEELENALYDDVVTALGGIVTSLPAANKAAGSSFAEADMKRILATVSAYGKPVIFTSYAFAQQYLVPAPGWVSDVAREEMRNQGYLGKYYGADVVILEQSFTDATNTKKILDETIAYIMPTGSNEAPIKVSLEGDIKIRDMQREDWSFEMQLYRKVGLAIIDTNYMGIYKITG